MQTVPMAIDDDNFRRGAIAIAVNGIPIFNPYNASGLISYDIGELDGFGGHAGRGDDYHYHISPLHLEDDSVASIIAYAFDGYAIYGTLEPDGSAQDDLDAYGGHEYSDGTYHYHYGASSSEPYLIAFRGEITTEGTAPENQVTPQASAKPPRDGDPHGIDTTDLIITALTENSSQDGYTISYTRDVSTDSPQFGSIEYSWNSDETEFVFIFNDVLPDSTSTEEFTRAL
jgi:hypothetical protein